MSSKTNGEHQKYEKYSRWAERAARLILLGLAVEIIEVFILKKSFLEGAFTIGGTALILIGVWGEVIFEKWAKEASDSIVATANANAAAAMLETEKLRRENLELEGALAPRGLDHSKKVTDRLRLFAGTNVYVDVCLDREAQRFSQMLTLLLRDSDWQISRHITREPDWDGITIRAVQNLSGYKAAQALEAELDRQGHEVVLRWVPASAVDSWPKDVPTDAVIVEVGAKSNWYFLERKYPQLREAREESRRIRREMRA